MNRRGFFKKCCKGVLGACAAVVGVKLLPDAEPNVHRIYRDSVSEVAPRRWMLANRGTLKPGWKEKDQKEWEGRIHYDLVKADIGPGRQYSSIGEWHFKTALKQWTGRIHRLDPNWLESFRSDYFEGRTTFRIRNRFLPRGNNGIGVWDKVVFVDSKKSRTKPTSSLGYIESWESIGEDFVEVSCINEIGIYWQIERRKNA